MKLLKPQKTPTSAADALKALLARSAEISRERDEKQATLRRLDVPGRFVAHEHTAKLSREARELLNGSVEGLLPPPQPNATEQIRVLRREIEVAGKALDEADRLVERLQREAAMERLNLRADDVKAAMAAIVDAILGLEVALQKRDALLKEIRPDPNFIPGAGWPLLGRVGRSERMAYRFVDSAAKAGWITEDKFRAAVLQSRKAMH